MESVQEQERAQASLYKGPMSDLQVLFAVRAECLYSFEASFALIIEHLMFAGEGIGNFGLVAFEEGAAVEMERYLKRYSVRRFEDLDLKMETVHVVRGCYFEERWD